MELLIGLAIVLAMSEWREHRSKLSIKRLTLELNKSKRAIDKHLEHQMKFYKLLQDCNETASHAYKASMESRQISAEVCDKLETVHNNVETILKEYELNGIPLGYQRKQFDVVEGL